jgi:hypothetical protein
MDVCLPLFEKPKKFGLHEEMLDEVDGFDKTTGDKILVSLAVANRWVLVDGSHDKPEPIIVAPSESAGRVAARRLHFERELQSLRVEIVAGGPTPGRVVAPVYGDDVTRFLDGTPLDDLTNACVKSD